MLRTFTVILACSLAFILASSGYHTLAAVGGALLGGFMLIVAMNFAYRRAFFRNTLDMIEAESLFAELHVAEAIRLETRRLKAALWWDRMIPAPRFSLSLPIFVSLITKCLQTRRHDEALKWIGKMEKNMGERAASPTNYFKMLAHSFKGNMARLKQIADEMRQSLDPEREEDRRYLAQLSFIEAKWAMRDARLDEARDHLHRAHDLQPDMDLYYLIKSQLALVSGDLDEAENYAQSFAGLRLHQEAPKGLEVLQGLMTTLRTREEQFAGQLEKLERTLDLERTRFKAQGLFQQIEVALCSRDATLLADAVTALEKLECPHPSVDIRLHIAAAHHFLWAGNTDHAVKLAREGAEMLDHPALTDDDVATGALWLAVALVEAGEIKDYRAIIPKAEKLPMFKGNRYLECMTDFLKLYTALLREKESGGEERDEELRTNFSELAAHPEASPFEAHIEAAAQRFQIDLSSATSNAT